MKTFKVQFTNGNTRSVEADSFCPCSAGSGSGVTFYINSVPSAFYANVAIVEPVETLEETPVGEVTNTAGQPAIVPPSMEVEQPQAAVPDVGSPS